MSYSIYSEKFKDGESDYEPLSEVEGILAKWWHVEKGTHGYEFVPNSNTVCDYCFLKGNPESGVSGLGFERPIDDPTLQEIVFDLLAIENGCFFGTDLEFIHSRSSMAEHYPEELLVITTPIVITTVGERWPF